MPNIFNISMIMPTKNRAKFLPYSIKSILKQKEKNWELILIDDHSTDNSKKIIKKFKDPRIKYYYLNQGTGPGMARDFGIKKAKGEIIVLADSDDLNKPNRLSEIKKVFENKNCDLIYSDIEVINLSTGEKYLRPSQVFDKKLLECINFIPCPTVGFKKKLYFKAGGFDKKLSTSEDYDLWLKFAQFGTKFCYINKALVKMQVHPDSQTKTIIYQKRKENLSKIRKKYHLGIPSFIETKKLIKNKELLKIFSTEHQKKFWFTF